MENIDYVSFGYSALIALGGVIGYVKAGSTASLVSGISFGGFAALGAYQLSRDPRNYFIMLVTSGILCALMGSRAYGSGKFMPAGLVASVSFIVFLRMGWRAVAM